MMKAEQEAELAGFTTLERRGDLEKREDSAEEPSFMITYLPWPPPYPADERGQHPPDERE